MNTIDKLDAGQKLMWQSIHDNLEVLRVKKFSALAAVVEQMRVLLELSQDFQWLEFVFLEAIQIRTKAEEWKEEGEAASRLSALRCNLRRRICEEKRKALLPPPAGEETAA